MDEQTLEAVANGAVWCEVCGTEYASTIVEGIPMCAIDAMQIKEEKEDSLWQ